MTEPVQWVFIKNILCVCPCTSRQQMCTLMCFDLRSAYALRASGVRNTHMYIPFCTPFFRTICTKTNALRPESSNSTWTHYGCHHQIRAYDACVSPLIDNRFFFCIHIKMHFSINSHEHVRRANNMTYEKCGEGGVHFTAKRKLSCWIVVHRKNAYDCSLMQKYCSRFQFSYCYPTKWRAEKCDVTKFCLFQEPKFGNVMPAANIARTSWQQKIWFY